MGMRKRGTRNRSRIPCFLFLFFTFLRLVEGTTRCGGGGSERCIDMLFPFFP